MSAPAIFTTSRLYLRPMVQRDSDAIFAIMSDDEAMRFWDVPPLESAAIAAEIVAGQIEEMKDGRYLYWTVCIGRDGPAIGSCDLSEIDTRQRRAEIGFLFHRAYWGNGYAFEAMMPVIGHGFGPLGLERLTARVHTGNTASARLLERLGFSQEGRLRGHVLREGVRRDCELYGLLKP